MLNYSDKKGVNRIIDANINRAKEGLRVCEEIARFMLNSRSLTSRLKGIRHKIDAVIKKLPEAAKMLNARQALADVGRTIYANELRRNSLQDVFFANIQRVKESVRVLEEFSKLIDRKLAVEFKKTRYKVYAAEKEAAGKIQALRHT